VSEHLSRRDFVDVGVTRRLLAAAAFVTATVIPGRGEAQRFWKETIYPLPYVSAADGLWLSGHYGRWSPIGFVERPEPYLAAINLDAGWSTQGSYVFTADFQAPGWWDGWRLGLTVSIARANRLGYFGLGNDAPYVADSTEGAGHRYFYHVSRSQRLLRLTLQRRLAGPLRAFVGGSLTSTDYRVLPDESVFRRDVTAGVIDSSAFPLADPAARVGIVFDTRDHEIDPHQGLFGEALYTAGNGYHRLTASGRAYIRPAEKLTFALRLAGEDVRGSAPLTALTTMESSERPAATMGGYTSLRGYYENRWAGPGKLLGNVEARYALIWAPTLLEVKLVLFYEAGRVFDVGEAWRFTTEGLHSCGGVELAGRFQRNTLIVVGAGAGNEGVRFQLEVGWSF
jgi:outer membrane protein assembly factor BamA